MENVLETYRLILRKFTEEDVEALAKIVKDRDGNFGNLAYAQKWIDWCLNSYEVNGFGHYAVILKSSGEVIGSAGISMQTIDDEWKQEIGYHLRSDYHRQGLGTEVALALRDFYFEKFNFGEVYSYMDVDNIPSARLAEIMGMSYLHNHRAKDGHLCKVYRLSRNGWLEEKDREDWGWCCP